MPDSIDNAAALVALSMSAKGKELTQAKAEIADGATIPIHITAEIHGTLGRDMGSAAVISTQPAKVNLCTYEFMLALLGQLSIGAKRMQGAIDLALEHVSAAADADALGRDTKSQALGQLVDAAAATLSANLPHVPDTRPAKAGRLSFDVSSVTFSNPSCSCTKSLPKAA